ncbi:MAG: biosynthetic arginine decarboxylase [Acidobacteria bacterium]|nr:MAG: biosynthetic arginine decarboxylase [Acidobacteriota bacterium]
MNVSVTDRFKVEHATELYGLEGWGGGYFAIQPNGHLAVTPRRDSSQGVDLYEVVTKLRAQGIRTPVLLRFPQVVVSQVERLTGAFQAAIDEYDYPNRYAPLFPIKVNQQRAVVEALLDGGRPFGIGLEVGSRPELLVAAALPLGDEALIVCNGFKDKEYLASAALATRLGRRVVVVIEKPFELDAVVELARRQERMPMIGFRLRLQARGSGLWERSGGVASKFGLTTRQLLVCLDRLQEVGLGERVSLLHFHIGSQITEIRKIKNAVQEAGRVYAKLRELGVDIRYLDVGGGLGVDYDGSGTSSDASVNYSVQEYANDVVFGLKEVCEQEDVDPPAILSESGRMLVAHHSLLVTDVRGAIAGVDPTPIPLDGDESQVVQDLAEVARMISVKNYREFYHDAIDYRDQMYQLFNLGMLRLDERAKAESLFWSVADKAVRYSKTAKFTAEEFLDLESRLHDKYICNLSVFQSLPDHWALDQLFPVMPIHRLDESPSRRASLVDITCDSDGAIDKFIDRNEIKNALEVHELIEGEIYYLGFMLLGAYQDTMGDLHNLFGRVHEVEIVQGEGGHEVRRVLRGELASDVLKWFGYAATELIQGIECALEEGVEARRIAPEEAAGLLDDYRDRLAQYTYLD